MPAAVGSSVCLYTVQPVVSSKWTIYNVASQYVTTLTFGAGPSECWTTVGVGRGLYYVKLEMTFSTGANVTEWHPVVLQ
jgi:hypothetical protein